MLQVFLSDHVEYVNTINYKVVQSDKFQGCFKRSVTKCFLVIHLKVLQMKMSSESRPNALESML